MDTKSKNSKKWLGNLLCILVVVVLAAGTIICYPRLRMGAEERMNVYRDRAEAETSANLGEDQPIEAETETDTESDVQLEVYYENPYVETKDFVYKNSYDEWIYVSWRTVLAESGLPILVGCVTVLLALAALLLPLIPSLGVGESQKNAVGAQYFSGSLAPLYLLCNAGNFKRLFLLFR